MNAAWLALLAGFSLATARPSATETVWLSSLDLSKGDSGWGKPLKDKSVEGNPMAIGGRKFERGVGTHAPGRMYVDLGRGSQRFHAWVGLDDEVHGRIASVEFRIYGDGNPLWRSGVIKAGQAPKEVDLNLQRIQTLLLVVRPAEDNNANDHADWAEARLDVTGVRPKAIVSPWEAPFILTPKPGPKPRLNGPKVYGCRPNHPFLYRIAATGARPLLFGAENLPAGLALAPDSGIITGSVAARGEYLVKLRAANAQGKTERDFKIVCGALLALTPPMGWNHWYIHEDRVTDQIIRQAADIMVASGMADLGYDYVNIDGCWTFIPTDTPKARSYPDPLRIGPARDARGNLLPNRHFPDMNALTEYIHAKGLRAGIYTSPGPYDCAGFAAAYQHEAQDAKQYADWGFDFLKYDWCTYGQVVKGDRGLEDLKQPYRLMGNLLKQQPRDIVFNLCQYGMGNVWEWGAEVGGHSWRTAGDLGMELSSFFEVALNNAQHRNYSRPGSWNDPDYIQIGYISDWRNDSQPVPTPLTPNEQYSFMSLWCLMAAPLIFSGDMSRLDDFTLNVLCNAEVIEVDQDPLGQCAQVVPLGEDTFAMVKDLEDGSKAVGVFNRGELPTEVNAKWSDLKLPSPQRLRDLWRQKDLDASTTQFSAKLSRRAGVMLRLWPR